MEIFKSTLSLKLKKRLSLLKHSADLKNHIDQALLPQGGTRTEAEMMEAFSKLRAEKRENLLRLLEFKVDWSKVPHERIWSKEEDETVGSFRRLEID